MRGVFGAVRGLDFLFHKSMILDRACRRGVWKEGFSRWSLVVGGCWARLDGWSLGSRPMDLAGSM